ncbi:MAG: hypothetical protein ABI197_07405, partial [Granulicella sp.]
PHTRSLERAGLQPPKEFSAQPNRLSDVGAEKRLYEDESIQGTKSAVDEYFGLLSTIKKLPPRTDSLEFGSSRDIIKLPLIADQT